MAGEVLPVAEFSPRGVVAASSRSIRRIRVGFWAAGIVLAILQSWERRYQLWDDGVAYLDIADAYMRGDFRHALNAYWSPMYSWILGAALRVVHPPAYWETCLVHAVNVVIFLFSMAGFE